MASGQKSEKINTRERVVSDDWNRMQSFIGAHLAELARWMFSSTALEGGAGAVGSATTSPLSALIIAGLWARPEIGTVNLFIEPGLIGMVNPDSVPNADDSPFKVFEDAGVQLAGSLTLTAGAVSTRLDVIECSRVDEVIETDNRDIFNPATGLFTPVLVDKVQRSRLAYRIRLGTPGAGFPGTASGWLPLAVSIVPSSATTWNDCILFDVRPLMQDLVRSPTQVVQSFPHRPAGWATANEQGGTRLLHGYAEAERRQWRVGGEFGATLSGLAAGALDLNGADVIEPGFAPTNNTPWYVYAVFPHALPRWARYSPSSTGLRQPQPFKGIPVFTQKAPVNSLHQTAAPFAMPTTFGFTANQQDAVPLVVGAFDIGGNFQHTMLANGWHRFGQGGAGVANFSGIKVLPSAGAGTTTVTYDLIDNTTHPVGAVMLRMMFTQTLNGSGANVDQGALTFLIEVLDSLGNLMWAEKIRSTSTSGSTGITVHQFTWDIPLNTIANMPAGSPVTRQIKINMTSGDPGAETWDTQEAHVVGWKLVGS